MHHSMEKGAFSLSISLIHRSSSSVDPGCQWAGCFAEDPGKEKMEVISYEYNTLYF